MRVDPLTATLAACGLARRPSNIEAVPHAHRSILFLSKSLEAASTRHRAAVYFDRLRNAGWSPTLMPVGGGLGVKRNVLRAARRADVVVLMRKLLAWPIAAALRRAARRLVFDMDDAIYTSSSGEPSRTRATRFERVAKTCDAVWAGNSHLVDRASQHNDNVTLLPTSLDPHPYAIDQPKPTDYTDVVWIGSSATRPYLERALPMLVAADARFKAEGLPPLRLKIVADFDLSADCGVTTWADPWGSDTEAASLASSHVGIAPMPDDPWTRGKCGFKVLQYLAAGLPVVVSDVGVHQDIVDDARLGVRVGDDPQAWAEALVAQACTASDTASTAFRRQRIVERFSHDAAFDIMQRQLAAAAPL